MTSICIRGVSSLDSWRACVSSAHSNTTSASTRTEVNNESLIERITCQMLFMMRSGVESQFLNYRMGWKQSTPTSSSCRCLTTGGPGLLNRAWLLDVGACRFDQVVGRIDLARTLFGHRPHRLRQATRREFVRVILADQFAVGALNLSAAGLRRDPECRIASARRSWGGGPPGVDGPACAARSDASS